jgi:hypothetical protein
MSGYRESSYDPYAYEQAGRPMRPFNWVQWTGVAFMSAAIATLMIHFAGKAGLIPPLIEDVQVSFGLSMIGLVLINSRRQPGTQGGADQLARNRKVLAITVAVVAVVLGVAAAIQFTGA